MEIPLGTMVNTIIFTEQATDASVLATENWGLNMEIVDFINYSEEGFVLFPLYRGISVLSHWQTGVMDRANYEYDYCKKIALLFSMVVKKWGEKRQTTTIYCSLESFYEA